MLIEVNKRLVNYKNVQSVELCRVPLGYAVKYHMKDGGSIMGDCYTDTNSPVNLKQSYDFWRSRH